MIMFEPLPTLHNKYNGVEDRWLIDRTTASGIVDRYTSMLMARTGFRFDDNAIFRKDRRSDNKYLYNLHDGWCCEDLVRLWLLRFGINPKRNGCDADRIVQNDNITTEADLDGLEIQFSDNDLSFFALKKAKGDRLIQEDNLCITIIPDQNNFFITIPDDIRGKNTFINKRMGDKECYMLVPWCYRKMSDGSLDWPEDENSNEYYYKHSLSYVKETLRQKGKLICEGL